uniref:Acetyl-coenzyme A carboxylase carboxyl transferase subunit beta, chloroplastic n=1 Tax=Epimedium elatum TaxID=402152 RepID=A0A8F7KXY2_9MAGN|nr:acetyl-CoA carboxylase beta subunit [Epimedium elatum]
MEKENWRFNSMFFKRKLAYRCVLRKSMEDFGPIGNTNGSENPLIDKNTHSWEDSESPSCDNIDHLFHVIGIPSFLSDDTSFLVQDSDGHNYSIYFDIENNIFEIDNEPLPLFRGKLEKALSRYSLNSYILNCIDNYLDIEILMNSDIYSSIFNVDQKAIRYIVTYICYEMDSHEESDSHMQQNPSISINYKDLWVLCENCYELNYKRFLKEKLNICEHCGSHLKMSSSDRIELLIDPGTWAPMDEDMFSVALEFDSEEEDAYEDKKDGDEDIISVAPEFDSARAPMGDGMACFAGPTDSKEEEGSYIDRIDSYQKETGLNEAVQTGIGQLNGIPIAIGVMEFQFMGGSMGSVVGEKITRLIEYATDKSLPVIIVCASGGARMQEGSLSLMQMAKISSASYNYQSNKNVLYVSILTSPTTGGVTASFGMLGDIIIAEPNAYIAFAGKRVIEETLKTEIPEGSQETEYLFEKGLFDPIVPRNPLKGVLSELFQLHGFFPVNQNESQKKGDLF